MAGGKGERFWPMSTEEKPKQFLKLLGQESMLQMTVNRLKPIIPLEHIFIVTTEQYVKIVEEQLPELPIRNIIIEPMSRNTAPCIALSTIIINKYYKDAVLVVLPSDQLIVEEGKFCEIIKEAYQFVLDKNDSIVILGIKPNRAETGYGYIEYVDKAEESSFNKFKKVTKFIEKPNLKKAKEFFISDRYLWNAGIFVWKSKTILELTKLYMNNTYMLLNELERANDNEFNTILNNNYKSIESISIDYGIMEKAKEVYVIPSDIGWDDIGTWYSLERYKVKDKNNNILVGEIKSIDSNNNIIIGSGKPIVVVGLDDIIVVESNDIIFIGNKENIKNIKELKNKISEKDKNTIE
jgi:mannose-1-phosphate guanylyltransferase